MVSAPADRASFAGYQLVGKEEGFLVEGEGWRDYAKVAEVHK